jgi:MHS family shikimate/dehydroshikimate transporter-like MFS transporter
MDSTLTSARPNEETPSLNRARRAALGSFAGAVVDWYDFLLYGITAALVFNREFFPRLAPRWARSPRLPPSAWDFCSALSAA